MAQPNASTASRRSGATRRSVTDARSRSWPGLGERHDPRPLRRAVVAVQSALPWAHAAASYLAREGIAPLSAGGTVYSDEREMLDADWDYW